MTPWAMEMDVLTTEWEAGKSHEAAIKLAKDAARQRDKYKRALDMIATSCEVSTLQEAIDCARAALHAGSGIRFTG